MCVCGGGGGVCVCVGGGGGGGGVITLALERHLTHICIILCCAKEDDRL